MQIEIDSNSGFCYGVTKTIQLAEEALKNGEPLYCLGEIVHNGEEVERLKSKGLVVINTEDLNTISNAKVLVRAHGEPPITYNQIVKHSNTLYEGTCPIVLKLQKKVFDAWNDMKSSGGQIVIYGKKDHAEVIGLAGQTNDEAIIISQKVDLDRIDFSKPIALFSQTTQSIDGYECIINEIRIRLSMSPISNENSLKVNDSICRYVSRRGEHLIEFSKKHNVIVFVSGTNSANGKVLFDICSKNNLNSFWVQNADEIRKDWFVTANSVGICGATSTPQWLMEKVYERINDIANK